MVLFLTLCGCAGKVESIQENNNVIEQSDEQEKSYSEEIFAMDTYMTLTAYGENAKEAVKASVQKIQNLDAMLSTGTIQSEIAQINKNAGGKVSEETVCLIGRSMELYEKTNGAFDITIYPMMKLWGFTTDEYQVPKKDEIEEKLQLVGSKYLSLDKDKKQVIFEKSDMEIDLGGIAKGYTSSCIMEIFKEYGITSGVVSLGGNVQVLGKKINGERWRVAIENPDEEADYLGVLETEDKAVITSGAYERNFVQDGKVYHHILNPQTGYPAESGLTSVTIVCEDGTLADGLSTALFVMGADEAVSFWKQQKEEFEMILVKEDGGILITSEIADDFYTENEIEIIN